MREKVCIVTREQVELCLVSAQYTFAKTMPDNPHYYTLKKDWDDKEFFVAVADWIQRNGEDFQFGSQVYQIHVIGTWRYWTMGFDPRETVLINRARHT